MMTQAARLTSKTGTLCLLAALAFVSPAAAQAPPAPVAAAAPAPVTAPGPAFTGSLLFSPAEVAALQQAGSGRVPGTAMLEAGKTQTVIAVRRVIAVSGVVYRSEDDWVVWINGKKVTPTELLPEIVDIRVERERVRLKWFDIGINNVISIALRPHQTYDIVTGVLLPG